MSTELDCKSYYSISSPERSEPTDDSSKALHAASAPVSSVERSDEAPLKQQISAPCYFHSLSENEAPPFKLPAPDPEPKLLIGHVVTQADVVAMISASDADSVNGLRKYLGDFLIDKNIIHNYDLAEKGFLLSFLTETIDYAAQRDFSSFNLAVLLTIYLTTHLYFKSYYWLSPEKLWFYFKEIMIRHTIEDSPNGQEVFEPEECYDILSHFHALYVTNLPLIHVLTFGSCRLKLTWPFKTK